MRGEMRGHARPLFDAMFERPLLEELGMVDGDRLRDEWRRYVESGEHLGLRLYELFQAELWLRARHGASAATSAPLEAAPVSVP
jgi:hypothetical protein